MNCLAHRRRLLAFLLVALSWIVTPAAARPEGDGEAPTTPAKPRTVLRLTIKGPVFEGPPPLSFFGGAMGTSLEDLLKTIRSAATDPGVHGFVLRLKSPALGWTQLQAVRRELIKLRSAGKPSYCHVDAAIGSSYLLASACSEVSLLPTGVIEIPGVGLTRMYMKELLQKIGIDVQELRMGRYKSAAETFTRTKASEPVLEETHALLDDLYEEYVGALAENISVRPVLARGLVDTAVFLPEEAVAAGLVDRLEYEDEFLARIEKGGASPGKIVDAKIGKSLKLEVGGFAGMMSLLNEMFGGPPTRRASSRPKIAIVHGVGPIVQSGGQGSLFGESLMTSDAVVKLFRQVREDKTVKAVVFRVDSPGGSALASDLIWREVELTSRSKPVVVSMGDLAASGGYYVSCAANWIVAERGTLTGSIGVIGAIPNLRGLFETVGLRYETLSRGKRAGMISPYGEMTDDGREVVLKHMRKIYEDFVGKVAKGRKLPTAAVESVAEGRVWTGVKALKLGLVDELGGLDAALARARKLGGVAEDAEILSLPRAKTLFELLSEMEGGALGRAFAAGLPAGARGALKHLEWVRALARDRVLAVAPALLSVTTDVR